MPPMNATAPLRATAHHEPSAEPGRDDTAAFGVAFEPIDDPRHNPFDWEVWHECDVFRAGADQRLVGKP
jgi:hypothetical protein